MAPRPLAPGPGGTVPRGGAAVRAHADRRAKVNRVYRAPTDHPVEVEKRRRRKAALRPAPVYVLPASAAQPAPAPAAAVAIPSPPAPAPVQLPAAAPAPVPAADADPAGKSAGGTRKLSTEGSGALVAFLFYPLLVNALRGGPAQAKGWLAAKFINQPYNGPGPKKKAQAPNPQPKQPGGGHPGIRP